MKDIDMVRNSPQIFALSGNPIGHSLSPLMHNAAFKRMKIDAHYVPFCVKNLEDAVRGIRGLDIRGVSITIPFKTTVMSHLDELDESSLRIGAVNTILHDDKARLKGYNTDWIGLIHDLKESLEIGGKTFAILGAGGAARAAVFGILREGGMALIVNRTIDRGEEMARNFGCPFYALSEIGKVKADCLVIDGNRPHGAGIETYDDHRIAMSFAILGLRTPGIRIRDRDCVNKSFPGFWEELKKLY